MAFNTVVGPQNRLDPSFCYAQAQEVKATHLESVLLSQDNEAKVSASAVDIYIQSKVYPS